MDWYWILAIVLYSAGAMWAGGYSFVHAEKLFEGYIGDPGVSFFMWLMYMVGWPLVAIIAFSEWRKQQPG